MTLVWPARQHLDSYTAALHAGWSPDNVRGDAVTREQLARIASNPEAFLASLVDRNATGDPIERPDGTRGPRLPGHVKWMWDASSAPRVQARNQESSRCELYGTLRRLNSWRMLARGLFTVACAFLLWPSQANAQIYAWRDASGNLVLSDRQFEAGARTYSVEGSAAVRTPRPVASLWAAAFEPLIQEHARAQGLRPDLVRAVIQVESAFNPRTRSRVGAMGLMQLMPATARGLGVRDPYDPADNIRGGTMYLRQLLDKYDGNEELALAAYNAGPRAVDRFGRQVPPFQETRNYVRQIGSVTGPADASPTTMTGTNSGKRVVYKTIEIINGQPVPRYSTQRPASGAFEIIQQ